MQLKDPLYGLRIQADYRKLRATVEKNTRNPDLDLLKRAFQFANRAHREQRRLSGEPYIIHPLAVGVLLAEQGLDNATICAGLLHDVVEDTAFGEETIQSEFGSEIHALVKAVTKISNVKKDRARAMGMAGPEIKRLKEREAAENIRLMLLATARDVRVILIKLADKLHNMRTLQFQKPEKVERIANEVMQIYAPIAGRLGMFRVKSELEDLAFMRLNPEGYRVILEGLKQSRGDLEDFLETVRKILKRRLSEIKIEARIDGRAKHMYSIHQKMMNQDKTLGQIYDLRGIRIIVEEIRDCYGALGIVHTLWTPIHGRFKDYVATPKVNGYQSLHTTVLGPDGRPLEIQIRTRDMDERAEYGIAAHWLYKSGIDGAERHRWLQRLTGLTEYVGDTGEFIEDLKQELDAEEVYVFTPKGDIIDLPVGSTVLDFAFRIHTHVGLRCKGARVNDRMVPLRTELKSGDRVEVLTDKNATPSPNWLRYLQSPRASQKLRAYLRKQQDDEDVQPPETPTEGTNDSNNVAELRIRRAKTTDPRRVPIEVAGENDIPVRYAGCCTPVPGDRIVGFITRGRGVTVHRVDCPNLAGESLEKDRLIQVRWEGLTEKYPVQIDIHARDRQGLYLDLVGEITKTHTNILKAEADLPRSQGDLMRARFLIEVEHVDHLRDIIDSVMSVPGVVSVERMQDAKKQPH
ncbi:MAG: bifunctional (p)ppGpp synthetase/guanosine-3',5'-bis(diphosphate) 3'-pyrophosphohydrolase [Leptospirales bacterium]|nr:bifunctional (p)ppGpp synthetase/guanosine-3',5'-bis(diphosphate) 3'-pyrophosphohydrolase [Leptospirales bacterium]HNE24644.1 bifunctional (p)ppGpp synthetase/guanosine-3',5'-bis(diphosphate) 3'-pyrophosphohydrolase [Leptospiraceae bacterium]HNN76476.1 bifunctional (p)ppGpp synthetase/guanosine-3',5'-bis(diphosphate) 3'-pyrophosphohydrolase [Leptospiraceae bacterium]